MFSCSFVFCWATLLVTNINSFNKITPFFCQAESNMNDLISEYQQYQEVRTASCIETWTFVGCFLPDIWINIVMLKSTSQATIDDDECFDGEEEEQDQD